MAFQFIEIIFVICFGLVNGSFATALVWRLPRDIPILTVSNDQKKFARSACPRCKKKLSFKDLVPLFSWIFLKGECRYCGKSIGLRYPLIEAAVLLGCLGVYSVWGFTVPAFIIMAAVPLLVALLVIDLDHMILPNKLVFFAAVLAIILFLYQWLTYSSYYGFGQQAFLKMAGMAVFAFVAWMVGRTMEIMLKKEALGMGDVKFFAMAGLWLGVLYLPFFLIFAGLCGLLIGVFYRFYLKKQLFPFGPALILALYTGLLLQGLEIIPLMGVQ